LRLLAKTYGIKEKYIVLEVLEYGEIEDMEMIDAIFSELRQIGFKIAIDDYPSGYNTLAFVTRFKNIDIIKIDGMHVVDMYRTCHSCQSIDTCIQPFLRDVRVTDKWHCIRRLNEKYDLESLMQSFRFLKILYPNLVFFAERIEDDGVYSFFSKIPALISGYQ
jgi:predicted signal transduction protein with EAL and GGDEF domain